jgi:hypothetical protein
VLETQDDGRQPARSFDVAGRGAMPRAVARRIIM